jgi:hypothetical protein
MGFVPSTWEEIQKGPWGWGWTGGHCHPPIDGHDGVVRFGLSGWSNKTGDEIRCPPLTKAKEMRRLMTRVQWKLKKSRNGEIQNKIKKGRAIRMGRCTFRTVSMEEFQRPKVDKHSKTHSLEINTYNKCGRQTGCATSKEVDGSSFSGYWVGPKTTSVHCLVPSFLGNVPWDTNQPPRLSRLSRRHKRNGPISYHRHVVERPLQFQDQLSVDGSKHWPRSRIDLARTIHARLLILCSFHNDDVVIEIDIDEEQ